MLNIFYIAVILVFIIDLSGFVDNISKWIWKKLYPKVKYTDWRIPKPFSCSLCATFWSGLAYLGITGTFSWLMFLYVCLLSFLTPVIANILIAIKDGLIWLVEKMYELFN